MPGSKKVFPFLGRQVKSTGKNHIQHIPGRKKIFPILGRQVGMGEVDPMRGWRGRRLISEVGRAIGFRISSANFSRSGPVKV